MHTFVSGISNEKLAVDIQSVGVFKPVGTFGVLNVFPVAFRPDSSSWLLLAKLQDHTQTHHTR